MKHLVVTAAVLAFAALAFGGWRSHERSVRLREAPACAMATPLGDACGRCVAAYCCAEITACYGRSDCIDLNDCTIECGEKPEVRAGGAADGPKGAPKDADACRARCAEARPQAAAAFRAWDGCARSHCESECPRGEDD